MRGFIKTLAVFAYIFLALFIQPSNVFACENFAQNSSLQYISSSKHESNIINNRNKENYNISLRQNQFEITNPSNKNNNFGFNGFDKAKFYDILDNIAPENEIYSICISHNISPNLKNAIYTRAP